jgi:3-oxoacyl-[acyl-carrier protein] reductase
MISSLLDTILDRTVIPGYTSVGYRLRSHGWDDGELEQMAGRTVLVTGATSGLGAAAAEGFAVLGARVLLLSRDPERGERARVTVAGASGSDRIERCICDLSDMASVRGFAGRLCAAEPRLDVLVNNAGVLDDGLLGMIGADSMARTFAVNALGVLNTTQVAARLLARAGGGAIVNVTSIIGVVGNSGQVDMVRSLPDGIYEQRVASVALGRIGAPDEVARAIVWLASDDASYVTGQVLGVDGGMVI